MSIGYIEKKLGIPRSTLSGWFKEVQLTRRQKDQLYQNWKSALVKARKRAIIWHNQQKERRLLQAKSEAERTLQKINVRDKNILDLALAMLYLGEGFKRTTETGMGNSDPFILKFFIYCLRKSHKVNESKIKCELHLRADQNPKKIKKFWSQQLEIPLANFTSTSIDKRTAGKPTYPNYYGVCVIRCGNVAIQRKLSYISELYCDKVLKMK